MGTCAEGCIVDLTQIEGETEGALLPEDENWRALLWLEDRPSLVFSPNLREKIEVRIPAP